MGWKESQKRYQQLETLNEQKDEDLISRRVFNGLGLPVKRLPYVERRLFGEAAFDTALWPRAKRLFEYALRIQRNAYYQTWNIETCVSDHSHKDVLERMELGVQDAIKPVPLFFTRFKGTTSSFAYSTWHPSEMGAEFILEPPYSVLAAIRGRRIVLQETSEFIEHLGLKPVFEEVLSHEEP